MVSSVGSSYNVLSLFHSGVGSQSSAASEAVEAIIKAARQLKADASPARVQTVSAATDAWIATSEQDSSDTASAASATEERQTQDADEVEGAPETKPYQRMIGSVGSVFTFVFLYNHWLKGQDAVQASLDGYKSQLAAATDAKEQERLAHIVGSTEKQIIRDAEMYEGFGKELIEYRPPSGYKYTGTLVEQRGDGTLAVGVFTLSTAGGIAYQHDGSGMAQEYTNSNLVRTNYDVINGRTYSTGLYDF